ncbi:MAG: alpha-mannosidase [Clostridiales bacterium]|nr:alpha-mannosidase [Clostridiales bacterium]
MKKLHLICNAHIDPIWQWGWDEGIAAAIATFASAVRLAEKFDYVFCHNESVLYQYIEEYAPELFVQIQNLVREGKWHIAGGWFLQPDCNMPSGESIARQILVGKAYFMEKFGVFPTTAINYDSFGHSRGLVQILKKCGQDSYIITRPSPSQCALPKDRFIWKGFDGSTVKVSRACSYNTPLGRAAEIIMKRAKLQNEENVGMLLWGVGNHGGGPSRKDLSDIEVIQSTSPFEILHSTPEDFFQEFDSNAEHASSLVHCMPGCYTSMIKVKQKHIELENLLYYTEKLCVCASLSGRSPYPAKRLALAQEDLLVSEFHDILPGTCIMSAEAAVLDMLGHGLHTLRQEFDKAFFSLVGSEHVADEDEYPIFVFNPHPYPISTEVECELTLADQNWDLEEWNQVKVYDGNLLLPSQVVKESSTIPLDWRKKVVFKADLKPFGISRFCARMVKEKKYVVRHGVDGDIVLLGADWEVIIGGKSGLIEKYRVGDRVYMGSGAFMPVMYDDNEDPWAMSDAQLKRLGTDPRDFKLMAPTDGIFAGLDSVEIIEDGEVYLGIESFFSLDETKIRIAYKIYKDSPYIDINVNVFWNEKNKILKLRLPVQHEGTFIGQTLYGTDILHTDGRECVAQRYCGIDDGTNTLGVLNNCIYGCSFDEGSLYLTLVRGASYCAHPIHDRQILPSKKFVHLIDQGQLNYSFRVIACKSY